MLAPANTTILFWRSPSPCGARMAAACRAGSISKRCASWGWARRRVRQSRDPTAIAVVRQVDPPPEPGAVEPAEPRTDDAITDLPAPTQQPASTAPPPHLGSPEWQHQVAEGQKALLRRQGFSSGGPLKATPTFSPSQWQGNSKAQG